MKFPLVITYKPFLDQLSNVKPVKECKILLYFIFSIAYTALEDHESAFECYRKALELDPGNQSYQNNLEIAEQKLQELAANVRIPII